MRNEIVIVTPKNRWRVLTVKPMARSARIVIEAMLYELVALRRRLDKLEKRNKK